MRPYVERSEFLEILLFLLLGYSFRFLKNKHARGLSSIKVYWKTILVQNLADFHF